MGSNVASIALTRAFLDAPYSKERLRIPVLIQGAILRSSTFPM